MAILAITSILLATISTLVTAQRSDGQFFPCNPLTNGTGVCPPNPGLPTATYSIDFTQQTSLPADWTLAQYETVTYGPHGAEFTFAKRYDAPQLWTNFYILFGRVETVMQVAPGTGIISSSVLISDDFDEIDWEFSGNNFGNAGSTGMGQNNYFGKGITGSYDRGQFFNVTHPQGQFHTYVVDWSPSQIVWSIDGTVVRTLLAADADNDTHQFPQTPSKIQIGLWDGGDPSANAGTRSWAGGLTNLTHMELHPVTFYVKSVKVTNMYPADGYNYTDLSGSWESIEVLKNPGDGGSSSSSASSLSTSMSSSSSASMSTATTSRISSSISSSSHTSPPSTSTKSSSSSGAPSTSTIQSTTTLTTTSTIRPTSSTKSTSSVTSPSSSKSTTVPSSTSTSSSTKQSSSSSNTPISTTIDRTPSKSRTTSRSTAIISSSSTTTTPSTHSSIYHPYGPPPYWNGGKPSEPCTEHDEQRAPTGGPSGWDGRYPYAGNPHWVGGWGHW